MSFQSDYGVIDPGQNMMVASSNQGLYTPSYTVATTVPSATIYSGESLTNLLTK